MGDAAGPGAWRALATLSADLMALLDGAGRVVWVNTAFERVSGRRAEEAQGRTLAELLAVEGDSSPWPSVAQALDGRSAGMAPGILGRPAGIRMRHASPAGAAVAYEGAATEACLIASAGSRRF